MLLPILKEPSFSSLKIVGDVQNVLYGRSGDSFEPLPYAAFECALGSGSFFYEDDLGEALILGQKPFVTPPYEKTFLHTLEESSDFSSSFIMGIQKGDSPSALYHLKEPENSLPLQEIYEELALLYPLGFAILGWVECERAHATRLKKPPVYNENINDLRALYWTLDEQFLAQNALIFGIVLPQSATESYPPSILSRGFYRNPLDRGVSSLLSHTHMALYDQTDFMFWKNLSEPFNMDLTPISGVRHLATHSTLEKGSFVLFALNKILAD